MHGPREVIQWCQFWTEYKSLDCAENSPSIRPSAETRAGRFVILIWFRIFKTTHTFIFENLYLWYGQCNRGKAYYRAMCQLVSFIFLLMSLRLCFKDESDGLILLRRLLNQKDTMTFEKERWNADEPTQELTFKYCLCTSSQYW